MIYLLITILLKTKNDLIKIIKKINKNKIINIGLVKKDKSNKTKIIKYLNLFSSNFSVKFIEMYNMKEDIKIKI